MTAREYIQSLLNFDGDHPELHILETPIRVHDRTGAIVDAASYYCDEDGGYLHLDAPEPAAEHAENTGDSE